RREASDRRRAFCPFLPLVMDADTNQPLDPPIVIILSSLVLDDLETTEQGTLSLAPPPEAHQ
ncbi:hypothetical protein CCACVL1_00003, partial [Corchorus capsularis]